MALVQQTHETIAAAHDAADDADAAAIGPSAHDDANAYATAYFAVHAAYAAAYAADASYAADIADTADMAAASAANAADDTNSIWRSVSHDAAWLEATYDAPVPERGVLLLRQPLWEDGVPKPLRVAWSQFANSSFAVEHGFQPWIQWYEALTSLHDGYPPRQEFSDALALRIAIQPDEWWKRPAKEVNADIAQWLREETASGDRSDPRYDLVQALNALPPQQPAPYAFDWRDGRMEVLPPDALPEDGGIAQDYLDETREKADDLLEALALSNTDPTIARKVGRLREVLTDRAADLRPALVDSRSISVERLAKALDNPQDAAEIPTHVLADLGGLADTARRLCNCLPALWRRDAERLASSLTPDSASALLRHLDALRDRIKDTDIIGPDVQAAFDTLSEDSAEPDDDDVRRRRIAMFGLTARNLLTTLLRASKGAADKLIDYARNARKEFYPELVKLPAKLIIDAGVKAAAPYLFVALLEVVSGIATVFPEIEGVVRILEALKAGKDTPPTPPPSTEPPVSPRTPRPTAERGPTRPA
ncbi:hypothetical protein CRT60_34215 [Azospirillum palustre]|uniref:Uncharacterized protein n=1 Tax=Azospirillum palustre TaxID=2044885 RepID=A0A2B8BBP9_9PROT|nr:hypothetical protein CRT60_34215 [Azospirillum palustre]